MHAHKIGAARRAGHSAIQNRLAGPLVREQIRKHSGAGDGPMGRRRSCPEGRSPGSGLRRLRGSLMATRSSKGWAIFFRRPKHWCCCQVQSQDQSRGGGAGCSRGSSSLKHCGLPRRAWPRCGRISSDSGSPVHASGRHQSNLPLQTHECRHRAGGALKSFLCTCLHASESPCMAADT